MKLFARFLLWFFLNLLLLGAGFLLFVRAQFDREFLMTASAAARLQTLADDLADANPETIAQTEQKLGVKLHVPRFDDELPREVLDQVRPPPPPHEFGPHDDRPPPPETSPRVLIRAGNPPRYWAIVRNSEHRPLIIESESITGNGLFLNLRPWLVAIFGAAFVSALLWLPFIRGITNSVAQMQHATQQIAAGKFDVRVDARRGDELGALGRDVNRMAERLDGLVTGQKRFLGDIAHELCAPLVKLRLALGLNDVKRADEKADEIAALVNELLSFSKAALASSPVELRPVNLLEVVTAVVRREGGEGELNVPADLTARAEPELLTRALANLWRNALRYAPGPITITAEQLGDQVTLSVSDQGPGIPAAELEKVFDPFYRLDASRDRQTGGVGLGLAIVKTCVESCRGKVTAFNRQPTGLTVAITLPA
ncbi:MAG: ATP-binding protein [Verrucomicrobiota bacterium]